MLTLPLPIVAFALCLVAGILVWRLELGNQLARNLLTGAFGVMGIGTFLIALRFGYGFEEFVLVQRIVPLFIGPLVFYGFASFFWPAKKIKNWASLHLGLIVLFVVLMQVFPGFLSAYDFVIGFSYLFAVVGLFLLWGLGQDRIEFAPLRLAPNLRRWIFWAAVSLLVMVVFETIIAVSFAMQRMDQAVKMVSYGSMAIIVSLILVILVFSNRTKIEAPSKSESTKPDHAAVKLESDAKALLERTRLYLDTDLTLERLARRLHVPARSLSEAINQTQQLNVSQYVNGFRLSYAADLLETTDQSVSKVFERSGFLTRSNFYREFERVYNQSPIEYRKENAQ